MIRSCVLIFLTLCGFSIVADKNAEKTESCTTTLLIAEQKRISRISLCPRSVQPIKITEGVIGGLDYHASQRIYWSEMETGSIKATNFSGGETIEFFNMSPDEWRPRDIAIDYLNDNIYVLDTKGKKIHVVDLDTKLRTLILEGELKAPSDIAIDPEEAVIFVADRTRILRLNMDGSELTTIVSDSKYHIKALTIDPAHKRIFWSEQNYHRIKSANYDGTQVSVRIKNQEKNNLLGPAQLAYHDDSLYYHDDVHRTISHLGGIDSGKDVQARSLFAKVTLRRMILLDPELQSIKVVNPCDDAGCEHLCLIAKKVEGKIVSKCTCDAVKKLADDGKSCL